jgi:hypothetical protein
VAHKSSRRARNDIREIYALFASFGNAQYV